MNPIFFPGGDIGTLAVNGTVNDLATCGARPLGLSAAFIIEEGFAMKDFQRVVQSMKAAAGAADVSIICPDIHVLRDPTRGGVASTLVEIAESAKAGIRLWEKAVPVGEEVGAPAKFSGWTRFTWPTRAS
ncbi:MAG TPA: AIR synthase related protein [Opitutaceae bacterium]|nr:AIR synthase related protein [Opitutaceae bacterium]